MTFTISQTQVLLGLNLFWQFICLFIILESFVLVPCVPLLPHSHTPVLSNCLQKGEIWLMTVWQVILLLSLPECFELSLCIAKWHPSLHAPPPHNIITSLTMIHQSYLCISEWKPKGKKFVFLRTDLKVLVAFAQGHMPLQPLYFFSLFFARDVFHN